MWIPWNKARRPLRKQVSGGVCPPRESSMASCSAGPHVGKQRDVINLSCLSPRELLSTLRIVCSHNHHEIMRDCKPCAVTLLWGLHRRGCGASVVAGGIGGY